MKQYNVVIIGAGNIGAFFDEPSSEKILTHAHAFYNSDKFNLLGFYDVNNEKAREAANRWECKAYQNLDSALNNADVVCCCVPDEYHYELLKNILSYKVKLVFAEKPITKTMIQAEEIIDIYRKKNIKILVNYTRRFLNEFTLLKNDINNYGKFLKGSGYYGKGLLHNGSHGIDLIIYLLGEITGYKTGSPINDFYDDDPSVDVWLNVAGGQIALLAIDCRVATIFELDLFFEKARIKILNSGFIIERYEIIESKVFPGYYNYSLVRRENVNFDHAFLNAVNNIYAILEEKEESICSVEQAKSVLNLCSELISNKR